MSIREDVNVKKAVCSCLRVKIGTAYVKRAKTQVLVFV